MKDLPVVVIEEENGSYQIRDAYGGVFAKGSKTEVEVIGAFPSKDDLITILHSSNSLEREIPEAILQSRCGSYLDRIIVSLEPTDIRRTIAAKDALFLKDDINVRFYRAVVDWRDYKSELKNMRGYATLGELEMSQDTAKKLLDTTERAMKKIISEKK